MEDKVKKEEFDFKKELISDGWAETKDEFSYDSIFEKGNVKITVGDDGFFVQYESKGGEGAVVNFSLHNSPATRVKYNALIDIEIRDMKKYVNNCLIKYRSV